MSFIVTPSLMCLIVYFVFKKRDELGENAIGNTLGTIGIVGFNIIAIYLFVDDINHFFQSVYYRLGIPTLPAGFWQGMPIILVSLLGLIVKDFADYWNHRLMHTTWGWPTHAAHHSDTHVNAFTTYRVHFLETIVMSTSYVVLLTWLQMPQAIPLVMVFSHVHNLYVHMNIPFQHGPFKLLVASPVFHRWHHADVPVAYGKNLANIIPAWDWMFGTYYNPGLCEAKMGAVSSGIEDKNPFLIFAYPFQKWAQLIQSRLGDRTEDSSSIRKAN